MTGTGRDMLRYRLAAGALKVFSANGATRFAYRQLGNVVGTRRRAQGIEPGYVERADGNLRFAEKHGAIADGMRVMELGTGWVHWEALFTRLFYEVEVVLFDVWDNRGFDGFRNYATHLAERLPSLETRDAAAREKASALLGRVLECAVFDEVYRLLGCRYVVDAEGRLDALEDGSLDLVFSSEVMEHIPASTLPRLANDLARVLTARGHVNQHIVEADHLCLYAPGMHAKSYLRFSDREWARWFDNRVQYMNRWQHSDFVRLFRKHGFAIVDQEITNSVDTASIEVDPRWREYDKADLDATVTRLLVRRPAG